MLPFLIWLGNRKAGILGKAAEAARGGEGKAEKLAKPLLAAFEKDASELMRGIRLV